jgi:hypothetical protein
MSEETIVKEEKKDETEIKNEDEKNKETKDEEEKGLVPKIKKKYIIGDKNYKTKKNKIIISKKTEEPFIQIPFSDVKEIFFQVKNFSNAGSQLFAIGIANKKYLKFYKNMMIKLSKNPESLSENDKKTKFSVYLYNFYQKECVKATSLGELNTPNINTKIKFKDYKKGETIGMILDEKEKKIYCYHNKKYKVFSKVDEEDLMLFLGVGVGELEIKFVKKPDDL